MTTNPQSKELKQPDPKREPKINQTKEKIWWYTLCFTIITFTFFLPLLKGLIQNLTLLPSLESYYLLIPHTLDNLPLTTSLLTLLSTHISILALQILAPLLGIFNCIMLFALLQKTNLHLRQRVFCVLLFTTTPTILNLFTSLNTINCFLTLTLLGLTLWFSTHRSVQMIALIALIFATQINFTSALFFLSTFLTIIILKHKNSQNHPQSQHIPSQNTTTQNNPQTIRQILITEFWPILIISGSIIIATITQHLPLRNLAVLQPTFFSNIVYDLNGITGMSLFLIIIAIIGSIHLFKQKQHLWLVTTPFISLIFILLDHTFTIPLVFSIALLASYGIELLYTKKWKIQHLRNITLLLAALGILFTLISYQQHQHIHEPQPEEHAALKWISDNTQKRNVILSSPEYENMIKTVAQRQPYNTISSIDKQNTTTTILHATYINELFPLLDKTNASIIFLPVSLTTTLPQDQEFRFLLLNERFKLIFSTNSTQVWSYNPENSQQ